MFSKILVANRGEIAIRAFRAAYELGVDRWPCSLRGPQLRPPPEGRRGVPDRRARASRPGLPGRGGDHPGRPRIPAPTPSTPATASCPRTRAGRRPRRTRASPSSARRPRCWSWPATRSGPWRPPARRACPVLNRREPSRRHARADRRRRRDRLPAVRQGGRRRRRPRHAPGGHAARNCAEALAHRDAGGRSAFGDPTVFLEQAVIDPRHIEVQILADGAGRRQSTSSSGTARCSAGTRR